MSSHTIKVTPTYFPGSKIEFVLSLIEENESKEVAKIFILGSKSKFFLINSGLSDGWTKNSDYKELITNTEIDNLSNKEILEHYASYISKFYSQNPMRQSYGFKYSSWIDSIQEEIKASVWKSKEEGWFISKIWEVYDISKDQWRLIINENKWRLRESIKIKRQMKLPFKITQNHILQTQSFLNNNYGKKITLKILSDHLNKI